MNKIKTIATNRKFLIGTAVVLTAVAISGAAVADKRGWRDGDRGGRGYDDDDRNRWGSMEHRADRMVDWLDDELDLTTEQELSIEMLIDGHRQEMEERMKAQLDSARQMIVGDELSVQQARTLIDLRETMREEAHEGRAQMVAGIHAILTPAQREGVADLLEDFGDHGMRGKGKRRGGRH